MVVVPPPALRVEPICVVSLARFGVCLAQKGEHRERGRGADASDFPFHVL